MSRENAKEKKDYSIFVSYSRKDIEWVRFAEREIRAYSNYYVWWDSRLKMGQDWWNEICINIKKRDFFLFILTPDSIKSTYCNAEIQYASALNKPIIPVVPPAYVLDNGIKMPDGYEHIHYEYIDDEKYFLHQLESSLCDFKVAMIEGDDFAPNDVGMPELPKLSEQELFRVWHTEIPQAESDNDLDRLLQLLDQIIYSVLDGHFAHAARNKKEEIKRETERNKLYGEIWDSVSDWQELTHEEFEIVKILWAHFKEKYPGYDPKNIETYLAQNNLTNHLKDSAILDFDD